MRVSARRGNDCCSGLHSEAYCVSVPSRLKGLLVPRPQTNSCEWSNSLQHWDLRANSHRYGYLRGGDPVPRPKSAQAPAGEEAISGGDVVPLIDIVVETICACNDFADDGVQLQVIKALLTAITTEHCTIPGSCCQNSRTEMCLI